VKPVSLLCQRLDHYELAHLAAVFEYDASADFGEQRVVFTAPDIQAGLHASTALPHDDGPTGDNLSTERFESQPLRV